jgi:hypothetical protein
MTTTIVMAVAVVQQYHQAAVGYLQRQPSTTTPMIVVEGPLRV